MNSSKLPPGMLEFLWLVDIHRMLLAFINEISFKDSTHVDHT